MSWRFLCLMSSTHCYREKKPERKKNHTVSSLLLWRRTDKNTFIPNTKFLTPIHGVLAHPCFISGIWQRVSPVQSTCPSVAYLRNSFQLQMSKNCCLHVFHKKSVIKLSDNSVSWANSGFTDLHQKRTCSQLLLTLSSSRTIAVNRHVILEILEDVVWFWLAGMPSDGQLTAFSLNCSCPSIIWRENLYSVYSIIKNEYNIIAVDKENTTLKA